MRRKNAFFIPRGSSELAYGDFPKSAYYVWATDTFMSGWGRAPGGSKNVIVFLADNSDEARTVARNLRDRDEMKGVTMSMYPPPDRPGDVFSLRDKRQAPRFYDRSRPFRENPDEEPLDGGVTITDPDYDQGLETGAAIEAAVDVAPEVAELLLANPSTKELSLQDGYAALLLAEAIARGEDVEKFHSIELPGGRKVPITGEVVAAATEIAEGRWPESSAPTAPTQAPKKPRKKAATKKPRKKKS